eukprot:CAMPEP_0203634482 /NCGR_PEP_ID=MMETSP0088-20131115/1411_1 /ASSEMBLY_ACC=CAM_ASM_001087 /TAXON_ID=426623 /ORGANISM="Chaetoceros affinis, Strain CCMP159" /LENGTH=240 /DNA_ID=CAMNT_0050488095 /DNA_START=306 /DNA_END=1028 /DNA_ORIENTATION=+
MRRSRITSLYAEEGETEGEGTKKEEDAAAEATTEAKGDDNASANSSSSTSSSSSATTSDSSNDILNSPAFLKRKLEVLESDIAKIDEKISNANKVYEENKAEWGSQLDDLRKEYINIQDRMKIKMKAGAGDANIEIARKILNVLDNYERAFGVVTPETDEEKEVEASYKDTYSMILKQFEDIGVKQVQTVGTEFNYEFHQAVMMRPDEDYEEGMVCEELAKGFAMEDGTLIRAAMVVVAA